MNLERELREALRRPDPPAGFAEGVMNRIARGEGGRSLRAPASRRFALRAAAALLVVLVGGWEGYRFEQRRRAEEAAEGAVTALRIASQKLNLAKESIEHHSAE